MIQRKQTLFLIAAIISAFLCLSMPVGSIEPKSMGIENLIYNICVVSDDGTMNFSVLPLFLILATTCIVSVAAIFMYKKRRLQIKMCNICIMLTILWYIYYALIAFGILKAIDEEGIFHLSFAACLPFVSLVFFVLARNGIIYDEKLIKSADRIR